MPFPAPPITRIVTCVAFAAVGFAVIFPWCEPYRGHKKCQVPGAEDRSPRPYGRGDNESVGELALRISATLHTLVSERSAERAEFRSNPH